jgi:hypothetical protein
VSDDSTDLRPTARYYFPVIALIRKAGWFRGLSIAALRTVSRPQLGIHHPGRSFRSIDTASCQSTLSSIIPQTRWFRGLSIAALRTVGRPQLDIRYPDRSFLSINATSCQSTLSSLILGAHRFLRAHRFRGLSIAEFRAFGRTRLYFAFSGRSFLGKNVTVHQS